MNTNGLMNTPKTIVRISNHITKVVYRGFTFTGNNTSEVVIAIYKFGIFKPDELEDVFGLRVQALRKRIKHYSQKYPERYAVIVAQNDMRKEFISMYLEEGMTLFEISHAIGCAFNFVYRLKRELLPDISNRHIVLLQRRHLRLCRLLFGVQYVPGSNFVSYVIQELRSPLTKMEYDDIMSHYIEGNVHTENAARLITIQRIGVIITNTYNITKLIEDDIICLAQKL